MVMRPLWSVAQEEGAQSARCVFATSMRLRSEINRSPDGTATRGVVATTVTVLVRTTRGVRGTMRGVVGCCRCRGAVKVAIVGCCCRVCCGG